MISILAIFAKTVATTLNPSIETVTIFFLAVGLSALAPLALLRLLHHNLLPQNSQTFRTERAVRAILAFAVQPAD